MFQMENRRLTSMNTQTSPQGPTKSVNWPACLTTGSPAMLFSWTNRTGDARLNFFRVQADPPFYT